MASISVYEYCNGKIVRFHFTSAKKMGEHFIRFQEHYESKEYAGKIFTLGEYRHWYTKKNGKWDYFQIVKGCNIPSHSYNMFKKGLFDPLTKEEKVILGWLKSKRGKFYTIATCSADETLDHELIHGLFYIDTSYRRKVTKYLKANEDKIKKMYVWLREFGYSEDVFIDEINAYISCGTEDLKKRGLYFPEELKEKLTTWKDEIFKEKGIT